MDSPGGGNQTVTQVQAIPQYQQDYQQNNMKLAQSIASNPYPTYGGQLQAQTTPLQQSGMAQAANASTDYLPTLDAARGVTAGALNMNPADPGQVGQYMSPFVMQSMMPQILGLQTQLGQQQNDIARQATQANAFGDARQGSQSALANFYGNNAMSGLLGQGFNSAFQNAQNQMLGQQQVGMQGGAQLGNLAGQQQGLGITGANSIYNAGKQMQDQQQTGLNLAYQQFQNQAGYPREMLNMMTGVLANNPYTVQNTTTLPAANGTASGLGAFASLAGLLGGMGGGSNSPFGGTTMRSA